MEIALYFTGNKPIETVTGMGLSKASYFSYLIPICRPACGSLGEFVGIVCRSALPSRPTFFTANCQSDSC